MTNMKALFCFLMSRVALVKCKCCFPEATYCLGYSSRLHLIKGTKDCLYLVLRTQFLLHWSLTEANGSGWVPVKTSTWHGSVIFRQDGTECSCSAVVSICLCFLKHWWTGALCGFKLISVWRWPFVSKILSNSYKKKEERWLKLRIWCQHDSQLPPYFAFLVAP